MTSFRCRVYKEMSTAIIHLKEAYWASQGQLRGRRLFSHPIDDGNIGGRAIARP